MDQVRAEQQKQQESLHQLAPLVKLRVAELDARSKAAVAWIAGGCSLIGVVLNAIIAYTSR